MAEKGKALTTRQRKFLTALLTARTIGAAAQAAGVGERTAYRYLTLPQVKRALSAALDASQGQATRCAVSAMLDALKTLETVHKDTAAPSGSRVSAARAIVESGPKLREALELTERVAELEANIAGGDK